MSEVNRDVWIAGASCLLPQGITGLEGLWDLLRASESCLQTLDNGGVVGRLEHPEHFDSEFFRMSEAECESLDPQHRLLLQETLHALDNAGVNPAKLRGKNVGCYVSVGSPDYSRLQARTNSYTMFSALGHSAALASNRISYFYDFKGPSFTLDSACSSGLTVLHAAVNGMKSGECDAAVVAAANLVIDDELTASLAKTGVLCTNNHYSILDSSNSGYARSEAVIVLYLTSTLAGLPAPPLGRVVGVTLAHNGQSNGITSPKPDAQTSLIKRNLDRCGVAVNQLGYAEMHATGTALGDRLELLALDRSLATREKPIPVGSVKSNVGHTEAAAGLAGLLKSLLAMQYGVIPATVNSHSITEYAGNVCRVIRQDEPWNDAEFPRFASVSSFGFGGALAHAVVALDQLPVSRTRPAPDLPIPLWIGTHSESAFAASCEAMASELERSDLVSLRDRLPRMRTSRYRKAATFVNPSDALAWLNGATPITAERRNVLVGFPGTGTYRSRMGSELSHHQVYASTTARLFGWMEADWGIGKEDWEVLEKGLSDIVLEQVATVIHSLAYFRLLQHAGVEPTHLIGHSLGEFTALAASGQISERDVIAVVYQRGRILQRAQQGAMYAVRSTVEQFEEFAATCDFIVELAVVNGPRTMVISCLASEAHYVEAALSSADLRFSKLSSTIAFHSSILGECREALSDLFNSLALRGGDIPILSTTRECVYKQLDDPTDYLLDHTLGPICIHRNIDQIIGDQDVVFVESGPGSVLTSVLRGLDRRLLVAGANEELDQEGVIAQVCSLYESGIDVDVNQLTDQAYVLDKLRYPFDRRTYWYSQNTRSHETAELHPMVLDFSTPVPFKEGGVAPLVIPLNRGGVGLGIPKETAETIRSKISRDIVLTINCNHLSDIELLPTWTEQFSQILEECYRSGVKTEAYRVSLLTYHDLAQNEISVALAEMLSTLFASQTLDYENWRTRVVECNSGLGVNSTLAGIHHSAFSEFASFRIREKDSQLSAGMVTAIGAEVL